MRTFRTIIAIGALVILAFTLFDFNFTDLSWQANRGNYLRIVAMTIVIIGMIIENISEAKKRKRT